MGEGQGTSDMRARSHFPLVLVPPARRWLFLACALALFLGGCRNPCELVERELHSKETEIYNLRADNNRLTTCNEALWREVQTLRGTSASPLTPEEASQTYPLRSLVLGRQTGGLDEDSLPGDEALQVMVEPQDADGHTLKVPGTLLIRTLEITPEGLKKPLSSWEISGDSLRRSWRSGLFSTGYYLILPWKCWPSTEKVRVIATLVLSDGRPFEAERDVKVRVTPAEYRKPASSPVLPAPPPVPTLPVPPIPQEPLPPPHQLPDGNARNSPPSGQNRPAAYWQGPLRTPLADGVQLLTPVSLPQRREWEP